VNAADLTSVTPGNQLCKYADDTYILVPAGNIRSREVEFEHIEKWAAANNLKINRSKCLKIINFIHRKAEKEKYKYIQHT